MHDTMTVAFEIRSPFKRKSPLWPDGYRSSLVTIWHVDPDKGGDDDSCDRFGRHRPLNAREKALNAAIWDAATMFDNEPHYPDSPEHKWYQTLKEAAYEWRKRDRRWWQHPRWHIHHWRLQVHHWDLLRRWMFRRCSICGGRFAMNEGNVIGSWDGKRMWHARCNGYRDVPAVEKNA